MAQDIPRHIVSPANIDEAEAIVGLLLANLAHNFEVVRNSLRFWDPQGAGYLARALKNCYFYQHGNVLGVSLRSLANTAIMVEHRGRATAA